MKIAMPYENGNVNPHFGHSRDFIIFETDGKQVLGSKIINNESFCHNHEGLAGLLKAEKVQVVITGGIGGPMITALQNAGFEVVRGASGDTAQVASDYLNGKLVTNQVPICSCEDH